MVKTQQPIWSQPSGEATSETVSAMVDGELDSRESMAFLGRIKSSPDWRDDWATYHLIGDTLRQLPKLSDRFEQQVVQRLAGEPTILSPRRSAIVKRPLLALSAAASVMAISFAAWQSAQPVLDLNAPVLLADNRNSSSAPDIQRRQNVGEYLIVHQEYSPGIAMQGVAPYVRTVYETQGEQAR